MFLLCGLCLKYNSDQFYQTFELRILSQLRVVSPCMRKYETHNARRVTWVLHHLNYLKIESVVQFCDVTQKMKISASGTYLMLKECLPFKVILQITYKSQFFCDTLIRVFFTYISEISRILEIYITISLKGTI